MLVNFFERANHELHTAGWCGQTMLTYVLNNLPKLIIKKTNRDLGFKCLRKKIK
jgi:hypothetical protein